MKNKYPTEKEWNYSFEEWYKLQEKPIIHKNKMKYKLYDTQRDEYKTDYNYNVIIYEGLEDIKNDLKNFHSIDNGGLTENEFESLTLHQIVDLFGWEIEKIKQ